MANKTKVMDSIKDFLIKMKALDEAIPEELAQDACEMVEEVKDALCEDEAIEPLEDVKDEETEEEKIDIEKKVEDAFVKVMRKYGMIKDEAMKSLEELSDDEEPEASEETEKAVTVEAEKVNDSAKRELLRKVKPMVASIKDSAQRKAFADAFAEAFKLGSSNQYGDLINMKNANAKDSMDKVGVKNNDADYDFGMEIARKFNPHYKKEG